MIRNRILLLFGAVSLMAFCGCSRETSLFNGKDLTGWVSVVAETENPPAEPVFSVRDGVIHVTGTPNGYLRTEQKYSDYVLLLEWRWTDGRADSGIYNRLQEGDKVWPTGIQLQLRESDFGFFFSGLPLEGIVADRSYRKPPVCEGDPERPDGEWNEVRIICEGGHLTAFVNDVLVNEARCDAAEGYIGFQSEGGAMDFRNIRIAPVK
ncbi:MAG: DUF1080 domain-containing protein [Bacteroidales bacterium]|nr:DUF1080 domain-containing protein [Bacteroidales bacterium]